MLPRELIKNDEKRAGKAITQDYLANKFTYASMKQFGNMKSTKKFNFDGYYIEEKKRQAREMVANRKNYRSASELESLTTLKEDTVLG